MKLPRDVSGQQLAKALGSLGYQFSRQRGSHMRYATQSNGKHYVTIPDHKSLRIGTLNEILKDVAAHHDMAIPELMARLHL